MTTVHLWDNFAGSYTDGGALGVAYQLSVPFILQVDGTLTGLRWYRGATGSTGGIPTKIRVVDLGSGTKVAECTSPSDTGSVGWQVAPLTGGNVTLFRSHAYRIDAVLAAGQHIYYCSGASQPVLPWQFQPYTYTEGAVTAPAGPDYNASTNYSNTRFFAFDLTFDDGSATIPGSVSTSDVDAVALAWLSSGGSNDHQADGLPWLTNVTVEAAYADTQSIIDKLGGASANWAGTVSTIINAIKDQTDLLPAGISTLTNAWLTDLLDQATNANDLVQQIVAGTAGTRMALDGGGSAFGPTYDQVDAIAGQVADLLTTGEQLAAYWDFPGSPWVMSDEQAFDTNLAYAEPAHLYVVSFNDLGANIVNAVVAGVDVSYRLAWWTPLAGANAHQRRFIDTPSAHLYDNGHKMPGVLLCSKAGGSGTIQAWSRF